MKKMLIWLMLLVTIPAVAQVRLGSPLDSIRKEFSGIDHQSASGSAKNGDIYYSIMTPLAKVIYLFNTFNDCYVVQIVPKTKDSFSAYEERYNQNYQSISASQWKANIGNNIADISTTHPDSVLYPFSEGYRPYFIWVYAEESSIDPGQTAEEYFNSGSAKQDLNDFPGAIADYTKAIELNPEYSLAYFSRGLAKFGLEHYTDGCSDLRKAAELGYAEATEAIKYLCR